ncbi:hypothetical protein [Pseudomonas oryzihabitans]|uniref:hypothetical protein n=1 Tax=Pseudomonas oryzihabitans TaxID=47885 RepID=UPI000586B0B4|nr:MULTISPECIES: hypothetical protein [Pseudomonas]
MTSNRERFEEWYLAEFWEGSNGGRAMLKKEPCGGYTYAKPQELWKVWQAAQPAPDEPVAIANRGKGAFWVRWTDAAEGLYGPGIKLYAAPPAAAHGDEAVRKDAEAAYIEMTCQPVLIDGAHHYYLSSERMQAFDRLFSVNVSDAAIRAQVDGGIGDA